MEQITAFLGPISKMELAAALLGLLSVWLTVKRNIWAFPIGIVMVIMYSFVFFEAKLYSDMGLQVVFVILQIQGWYEWTQGEKADDARIAPLRLSHRQWQWTGIALVFGSAILGTYMYRCTDAALPYIDATTTALSLLAQWWMNKKYIENWLIWIVADLIYLYQYTAKGLYLTTLLYAVFTVMAMIGHWEWKKRLKID